ncbi:MAG: class I SAM-dependent methyltransferase [Ignavibacteria bacterium]|nr:class I SAM-dependent methyltransferase [Ignavibacteria bacterium]
MKNEYYYNEAVSRFYDPVYDSITFLKAGLEFYLEEIKNTKGRILEAGVGTGRIFVPALIAGADIYGVDYSELMLLRLKEKIAQNEHYRIWQEDLRRFDSGMSFSLVIMPFRVFHHMVTIDDQLKTLNRIYNVLDEGGKLIFDVFNPDIKKLVVSRENELEYDGEYEPGKKLQRYVSVNYNLAQQLINLKFKYNWDENGIEKTDEFSTVLRYFFRFELENLVGRTKFNLEKIYGSFNYEEFSSKSAEQILILSK